MTATAPARSPTTLPTAVGAAGMIASGAMTAEA